MGRQFSNDLRWDHEGLQLAVSAMDPARAALMITRPFRQNQKHRSWIVYFGRDIDGTWAPEANPAGLVQVYDITQGGPFQSVDIVPAEVEAAIPAAVERMGTNDNLLVQTGVQRMDEVATEEAAARRKEIEEGFERVAEAREFYKTFRSNILDWGRSFLGDASKPAAVTPTPTPFSHREVIDFSYGPLVLSINGAEVFSLSSPGGISFVDENGISIRIKTEWHGDGWKGHPAYSKTVMSELNQLKDRILKDYAPQFQAAARQHVANVLFDINFESDAIDRYEEHLRARQAAEDAPAAAETAPRF